MYILEIGFVPDRAEGFTAAPDPVHLRIRVLPGNFLQKTKTTGRGILRASWFQSDSSSNREIGQLLRFDVTTGFLAAAGTAGAFSFACGL